jgi:nucleoside-diphosphate-sugar epimerase
VLFECATQLTPRPLIVHLSTMMVYGTVMGRVDETVRLRGDWDGYSAAKVKAERLARIYAPVVVLRPGIVYGPGSPIWTERIGRWLLEHRLGDLGAAGDGYCNLVHVDDVVTAVLLALRTPGIEGESFNLSLPAPPSWNEYFRQFAAALGTPYRTISPSQLFLEQFILAPPLKAAEILARAGGMNWRPPAPIRPWLLRLCGHPLRLDVGKAERLLGMRWRPLEQGLQESATQVLAGFPPSGSAQHPA